MDLNINIIEYENMYSYNFGFHNAVKLLYFDVLLKRNIQIICMMTWQVHISTSAVSWKITVAWRKSTCVTIWVVSHFFMEYHFYLKEWLTNYYLD